jgi:LysR family transcriptional regulator, mexEF-oprN operon transcriptional activator
MKNITDAYARDLDLNLLRVFAVVAEEGSLTRAAARLYVTQPAVSAAMRRLTDFLGAELVTREGHGVALTTRGAELLAAARAHLRPLVVAALDAPRFDPATSTATIRVGLADCLEAVLLPELLARLRAEAPSLQLVALAAHFRNVEEMLLSHTLDFAVTIADELPRSILRQTIGAPGSAAHGFVCLYDPRHAKVPDPLDERAYFAQEHVAVSYAGDVRGIVEDTLGKVRKVRVSVPAFGHVAAVVDGSPLLATVPQMFARHVLATRPHLRAAPLPFPLGGDGLEILWSRATDADAPARFVRGLVSDIVGTLEREPSAPPRARTRARPRRPAPG